MSLTWAGNDEEGRPIMIGKGESKLMVRPGDWFCGLTTEQIGKLANDEAMQWDTLWPNHDPSFLLACRSAFADGFMRGFRVRDDLPPNDQANQPEGTND